MTYREIRDILNNETSEQQLDEEAVVFDRAVCETYPILDLLDDPDKTEVVMETEEGILTREHIVFIVES